MPHALIGYAGSTVRAAEMFRETFPDEDLTVLTDYFGREVTDGLAVCARFPDLAASGRLAVRLDTHGGRFLEGLDPAESYAVLERHAPGAIRRYRSDIELRYLVGTGVSAAAIWHMRETLDAAGFAQVRIVVSSGFGVEKCRVMADARAPIDVVGTGSFIPELWSETYATADIVEYDGRPLVKVGREFLLRRDGARRGGTVGADPSPGLDPLRGQAGSRRLDPSRRQWKSRLGLPNRGGGLILRAPAGTGGIDGLAAGAGLRAGLAGSGIGRGGRADSGGGGAVWRQPVLCLEGAVAISPDRRDDAGGAAQPRGAASGPAL